ncbi:potassium channel subfamily K member 17 [Protobothrops mucrosquamatus]|uniref:potassium channel subfamily K member 17 n=1 Tax=Protobothrops mucrosquamatus TaxID=103944 RepID=UPI000775BE90|nr:potassium channel subfamily K member 17 [Protobothrops mucrosquamatus]
MASPETCPTERRCGLPSTLALLLLYLSYLLLGSAAFWALESPQERDTTEHLLQEKWELLVNFTCLEREALERLAENIIQAYKSGLYLKGNTSLGRWDFVGSFFFSVSTVTTIGYGNLSPNTVASQVLCIFFALFGIPLNLILLNRIGQLMLSGVHLCAFYLDAKFQWQRGAVVLTRTCALVVGLLLFLLLPPLLFSAIEGWTYEEGFYYSFITLSTIGFGDYVIGMNPTRTYPDWYKNVVSLWILFGLAWLALIINLCISLVENSRRLCQCCKTKSHTISQELTNGNLHINLEPEDQQKCGTKDIEPVRLD